MRQWLSVNRVLSLKERIIFYFLLVLLIGSVAWWGMSVYLSKTEPLADYGGEYIEGIVGQPLHVNPLISQSNNADEDLVQLIYSGLLKYDRAGQIMPDLAESYEISEDKTLYTVRLKDNVQWHDGQSFTAEDVVFTINLLSDPAYKSPLRGNWQGIKTEMVDEKTVTFKINDPYVGFLNNLTFGILPQHIWESIAAENFSLTDLNLQPIGTGPFKYSAFQKDSSGNIITYKLAANPNYFAGKPFLSKITFNFYADDDMVINAYNTKEIMGIHSLTSQKINALKMSQSTLIHTFNTPRYYAVFFNQTTSVPLAYDEVRSALAYATNRQEIIENVLNGSGTPVHSPILKNMTGYTEDFDRRDFDQDKANQLLDEKQWQRGDDGFRAKDGIPLEISLVTTDWPELMQTSEILKSQWERIGVKVNLTTATISDIQQNYIRPREYEALLFGQVLGGNPDPHSFWHSSNKRDPGLNLSLFDNAEADKLIMDARTETDQDKRAALYIEFQKIIAKENPAAFLYSPDYIYPINKKVQGITTQELISPARRFSDVSQWYIKTQRIWK